MLKWLGWLLLCVYGACAAAQAGSRNHIRVVLDLSMSMRVINGHDEGNDPGGMAVLSTILLHDLAHLNFKGGDSFKVFPFDSQWRWEKLNNPPQQSAIIPASDGGRAVFANKLKSLRYDAECTYFYPGVEKAVADLERIGTDADTRTIVLVTDGLPDNPCENSKSKLKTQGHEQSLIEGIVDTRMKAKRIRLFVLPFGPNVNEAFFKKMAEDSGGRVFFTPGSPKGENLLEDMLKLFADSQGYEVDGPLSPAPSTLELRKEPGQDEAAVVVFNPKSPSAVAALPDLRLAAPPGSPPLSLFTPNPLGETAPAIPDVAKRYSGTPGAAYSLHWVLNAMPGDYALAVKLDPGQTGQVAVLRKASAELQFIDKSDPSKTLPKTVDVMADTELPLALELGNGHGGAPSASIVAQFQFSTDSNPHDAPKRPGNDGIRTLNEKFDENRSNPAQAYPATIEAWASKNGIALGIRITQAVNVHPKLSIAPNPTSGNAGQALGKGDHSCSNATFKLEKQGYLPKPSSSSKKYTVMASLDFQDAVAIEQEFNGATFTLDGKPLQFNNPNSPASPAHASRPFAEAWFKGRELSEAELLGEHTFCVTIGQPKSANPAKTLELPLRFVLQQAPYDRLDVIQPFAYRLTLAEVKPLEPPKPPNGALLSALGLAALFLLWHWRGQPKLPADLAFALAPEGGGALAPRPLGASSLLRQVLGLAMEKPIIAANGEAPLAWVRAVDAELYQLRLGPGVALASADNGPPPRRQGDLATVSVHRLYSLRRADKTCQMRLEYRDG
jgi:hypothetical protein